jgi:hypothetical protein
MIVVQLLGGLGNQMFQYALGRHLSVKLNTDLKLDTSILLDWSEGRHGVNRNYDLDLFTMTPAIAEKQDIDLYHTQLMSFPEKVIFKLKTAVKGRNVIRERFFHFDESVLDLKGDFYLEGTWQSYKYFQSIEDIIKKDFTFKHSIEGKGTDLLEKIKCTKSVCLNVRRTDFVSVSSTTEILGFVGIDYYMNALELTKEKIGTDFNVFIFSDDIDWCKENFGFIEQPVSFVDHSYAGVKFSQYLQLMKYCKHYIIPNSTFAWWAAWLNNNQDKVVITPLQWMKDRNTITVDLVPSDWYRI